MNESLSKIYDFMTEKSDIPMAVDGYPLEYWDYLLLADSKKKDDLTHIIIRDEKEYTPIQKKLFHTIFSYWDIYESIEKIKIKIEKYLFLLLFLFLLFFVYSLAILEIYSLSDIVNTSKTPVWRLLIGDFITFLLLPIFLMIISVGLSLNLNELFKLKNRSKRVEKYCRIKYKIDLRKGEIPRQLKIKLSKKDKEKFDLEKKEINLE